MEETNKHHEKSEELSHEHHKSIHHITQENKEGFGHKTNNIIHHAEHGKKEELNYKPYLIIMSLVFLVLAFNQYMIFSLPISSTGSSIGFSSIGFSSRSINLANDASIQEIAAVVIPSEEDRIRPFSVNGQSIELTLEKNNILMRFDPFPPNGGRGRNDVPKDLTPEQQIIWADLMYGTQENNFQDAVGGCLFCNAPGGSGGCFKKGTIRGLTTLMLKQDFSKEEVEDELRVWMGYFFPGLAVKWAKYYLDQGLDPSTIPIDVQTFSRNGKLRVEAALGGQDISSIIPDQVGGCF